MQDRPRIKLHLSGFDKKIEAAGIILFVLMWMLMLYAFIEMPHIIPIHFSATGKPDNYGKKETLLLIPIIGTIIYYGITKLNQYPHIFHYPVTLTAENAPRHYGFAVRTLRCLKVSVLIILIIIILLTYLNVIGVATGIGFWFLPMTFGLLLIPTIIMIVKSFREK